jgi:enoyl-CoA hydratase/carnithine racemase
LILLGLPFDAKRAADLGFVTQVVSDQDLLSTPSETARKLAVEPAGALQASKRLMTQLFREQIKAAMKVENEEFSAQVRSEDAEICSCRVGSSERQDETCCGKCLGVFPR